MTLSKRYLLEPGRTRPATRLMATRARPSRSMPRRGRSSAQISGRDCQWIFFLAGFGAASAAAGTVVAVVAMRDPVPLENTLFDAERGEGTTEGYPHPLIFRYEPEERDAEGVRVPNGTVPAARERKSARPRTKTVPRVFIPLSLKKRKRGWSGKG